MYGLYKIIKSETERMGLGNKSNGFALLEVVIALIIFGLISGLSISVLKNYSNKSKENISQQNINKVHKAITRYVKRFKNLPCPSSNLEQNNHIGFAKLKCSTPGDSIGVIPYKTLAIPENIAKDGNNNLFTYVVDPDLTDTGVMGDEQKQPENNIQNLPVDGFGDDGFYNTSHQNNSNATVDKYPGKIRITDKNGIGVIDYSQNKIAYIIIQNIPDGLDGETNDLSDAEEININKSWNFYDMPLSENKNHRFRQRLSWVGAHTLLDKIQRIF